MFGRAVYIQIEVFRRFVLRFRHLTPDVFGIFRRRGDVDLPSIGLYELFQSTPVVVFLQDAGSTW